MLFMTSMPDRSYSGPFLPLSAEEKMVHDRLYDHVHTLAGAIGQRNVWHHENLAAAGRYIEKTLTGLGYPINRQEYTVHATAAANIEAELAGSGKADEIVLLGAHYDSVLNCPGANDNASGVAALLEIARLMRHSQPARTVRFVFFTNEEPPFFLTDDMGSRRYASRCRERRENIVAMLALETIGYYSTAKGSQQYPFPFSAFYPDTADFIAFVGNIDSRRLVRRAIAAFRRHAAFPSEGLAAPGLITGVAWSDHWSFWQEGYSAIMITDTAFFRYAYYHRVDDTPEKLDYPRMARVVCSLARMAEDLATRMTDN